MKLPAVWPLALLACGALQATTACTAPPSGQAHLRPTLEVRQADGGQVVFEQGRPVPTFSPQPRDGIDLDGLWHFQPATLDPGLTFSGRDSGAQRGLMAAAGDRLRDDYDDSGWSVVQVPGTFSPPPTSRVTGGWFRTRFPVSAAWKSLATLKFQSIGYVADVWLNGHYLGYHEGAWTPFALDASDALRAGAFNTLVLRVDDPPWGTRLDIVPWGLADWWNYGGVTGSVRLEATPALSVVRADVAPHLDGGDITVVLQNRGSDQRDLALVTEVLPADVTEANLLDPDVWHLVPVRATSIVSQVTALDPMPGGDVRRLSTSFVIRRGDLWYPGLPALYVLRVTLLSPLGVEDQIYETFGLRQIKVDSSGPRLLLNGGPVAFHGVALHDERQGPPDGGRPAGGPVTSIADAFDFLRQAQDVNADFIRADHHPANPLLLTLADRLGLAIWEEIPLYHYTPETFQIALDRGIAQQMLAEMVLRDMNHPAVLFHGLANESSGGADRASALATLRNLDRQLDGTRLTGQAAYGYDASDSSSDNLDVAGYTFYPGVFYGGPLDSASIGVNLDRFHARYPHKPILIMEFGRWADGPGDEAEQARVFQVTYAELSARRDTLPGGFVGAAVWWDLNDYWTQRPGLQVEHFGLYRPDGSMRPAGTLAAQSFAIDSAVGPPRPPGRRILSGGEGAVVGRPGASRLLLGLLAYAVGLPTVLVGALILLLRWRWKPTPAR